MRVEVYGTIDELNTFIGSAVAHLKIERMSKEVIEELEEIQHQLFDCGADLANITATYTYKTNLEMVKNLEQKIDEYCLEAPELRSFILPGGVLSSASIHICRTVCRRAERLVVHLNEEERINPIIIQYLNRLSDYFFALARVMNARQGVNDIEYSSN